MIILYIAFFQLLIDLRNGHLLARGACIVELFWAHILERFTVDTAVDWCVAIVPVLVFRPSISPRASVLRSLHGHVLYVRKSS